MSVNCKIGNTLLHSCFRHGVWKVTISTHSNYYHDVLKFVIHLPWTLTRRLPLPKWIISLRLKGANTKVPDNTVSNQIFSSLFTSPTSVVVGYKFLNLLESLNPFLVLLFWHLFRIGDSVVLWGSAHTVNVCCVYIGSIHTNCLRT